MQKYSTNGFTSSGMCHCVTGWVVPEILKDWSACIFRVKQAKSKQPFCLWLCNPEDKGTTILHNVWNHSPSDTVSLPRRHESLAKLLWELHNLQLRQHPTLLWLCSPSPSQQSGILMTGHLKVSMLLQVKRKHGHICTAQWQCYFFSILYTSCGQHGASGRTVRASLHPNLDVWDSRECSLFSVLVIKIHRVQGWRPPITTKFYVIPLYNSNATCFSLSIKSHYQKPQYQIQVIM